MRNRRRPTLLRVAAAFSLAIAFAVSFAPTGRAQIAPPSPAASPASPPAATPPPPNPAPAASPPAADTPSGSQPAVVPPGAATPPPAAAGQRVVRIGTNAVAGLYFPTGGAICRMMMRVRIDGAALRCLVDSTNGSTANVRGLRNGDLEFGIVQSDWQYYAVMGNGAFKDQGAVKELRSVFSLYAESLTVIVRKDIGIDSFEQIKGKRIAAGPPGSGQRILFDAMIAAEGWRQQDAGSLSDATDGAAVSAFCNGVVDVVVMMTHHPAPFAQDMLGRCAGRFLPVVGPPAAKVLKDRPYYAASVIPADAYAGQTQDTPTLGVRATLVTDERVPDDIVYALVKSVFDNLDQFMAQHPGLAGLKREEMVKAALSAPLHEGARRYFREKGLLPP